jgi:4-diphosphocytidyl-2-C-methyl-D-erythritol kinase
VLVPPVAVATAAIFNDPELTRDSPPVTIADFVAGDARNDCLSVVLSRYGQVREAFQWLDQRADARLTGTGACVFAALETRAGAEALLAAAPTRYAPFIARGCNISPLAAA